MGGIFCYHARRDYARGTGMFLYKNPFYTSMYFKIRCLDFSLVIYTFSNCLFNYKIILKTLFV
jgi:hypothetical protein